MDSRARCTLEILMGDMTAVVFVIDNDPSTFAVLENLVGSIELKVQSFATPLEFLASKRPNVPGCLVLGVNLPGASGLTFQKEIARMGVDLPIIFVTRHGDIPMSVRAMKAGAIDFLTKPFQNQDVLDAIHAAIESNRERRRDAALVSDLWERYTTLTARERQTMRLVVDGHANKQIAFQLGLREVTVKLHRGQAMRKMRARSLPELVRMADRLARTCATVVDDPHESHRTGRPASSELVSGADEHARAHGSARSAGSYLYLVKA
jgi:FixJ family two-component response regulator